ncbi:hypothetical protein SRABI106_03592 [Rahnella aquatilis]|nr:hypothetical protein SRABI106_03592 [Rahnella aquatilis]
MLGTAVNINFDALFGHRIFNGRDKIVDVLLTVDTAFMQQFGNAFVFVRMQITEAKIFQLPFQLADTQTVSQRRINIGTFFGRQYALFFRRIFHFAQMSDTFSQFQHHAAEIFHHRQQHAADVVHLLGSHGIVLRGFQLADGIHITHAMYQISNGFTELLGQGVFINDAVINQRKQQRRAHTVVIHAEGREDFNHLQTAP